MNYTFHLSLFALSYYNNNMKIEEKIIQRLIQKQKTLATAESCTGGLLASRLTDISGSSNVFKGGFVTYSNEAKTKFAKVHADLIKKQGAVCDDVAIALAQGVRKTHKADLGIGITGIAGPTGGTKTKPTGRVFIAVANKFETLCLKCQFDGTRAQVKRQTTTQALKVLLEFLE